MSRQAIKYQNTTVDPAKSVTEIAALVQKYGGTRFEQRWEAGQVVGMRFAIMSPSLGEVPVSMTAKIGKIADILQKRARMKRGRAEEQAYRIAWRHLKDLTEQLLLAVELGLRDVGEAFMADVEMWDDERRENVTLGEMFRRRALGQHAEGGIILRGALPPGRQA